MATITAQTETTLSNVPVLSEQSNIESYDEKPNRPQSTTITFGPLPQTSSGESIPLPKTDTRRQSLTFETSSTKKQEQRWSRNSLISEKGSAATRRRTYNGFFPTSDQKAKSRFSIGSIASLASLQTLDTYCTATSYLGSWHTAPSVYEDDPKSGEGSALRRTFRKLLQRSGLSSLVEETLDDEFDWCGRGMHVDFAPGEKIPLEVCDSAGHGSTSTVDVVKCRRVKLARKLMHVTYRTSQKELLKEAQTLQKLKHAHVVQLIGTYRQGRKFAALLYPVADMDLATYLEEARYMLDADGDWLGNSDHERAHQDVLSKGSLCLISALRYVHENGVKHMDIKPANILLKKYGATDAYFNNIDYKLYLCDFGIAQLFNAEDESQTETYPGKTPTYASPEVAADEPHGRASDVFSLGCVITEMATVYSGLTVDSLKTLHLHKKPYHQNLDRVRSWIYTLDDMKVSREVILQMLQEMPEDRASLVGQKGDKNVINLQCLHHHDPPDLFETDDGSVEADQEVYTSANEKPTGEEVVSVS